MTLNQQLEKRFSLLESNTYKAKLYFQEIIDKNKKLYPANKQKFSITNYEHTYFKAEAIHEVYQYLNNVFSDTNITLTEKTEEITNPQLMKKFPHGERNHILFSEGQFITSYFVSMLPENYLLSNSYSDTVDNKTLKVEIQGGGTFFILSEKNKKDPLFMTLNEKDHIEMLCITDKNDFITEYNETKNQGLIDLLNSYGYLNLDSPEIKDLASCLFDINLDFFQSEAYTFFKQRIQKLISELDLPTVNKQTKNSFK